MQFAGLYGSPGVHQILLEQPPSSKEMGWFHRTWVETKGKVTSLRDILASNSTLFRFNNLYVSMPTLITVGKQHDVVKRSVEGMQVTDVS
jgi:hypothetical protein